MQRSSPGPDFQLFCRLSLSIGVAITLAMFVYLPTHAATFVVTTTADGGPGSLRAAISQANATPGADTITLPAGVYVLALSGGSEDANMTGDLDISDSLTIAGGGPTGTAIDGAALDRVFHIRGPITVRIEGVTIRNGKTPAAEDGGGILNGGSLTLSSVVVENNVSDHWGGGLENLPGASASFVDAVVRGNTAYNGGGVDNDGGIVTLTRSQLRSNRAAGAGFGEGLGGGLSNIGSAAIISSTLAGNTAGADGGAIYADGTLSVADSTFSGNNANFGGGLLVRKGAASLTNVTISGNTAGVNGGGLFNEDGLTLVNVTIANNTAVQGSGLYNAPFGIARLKNTLLAANAGGNCSGDPLLSDGHNLDSANTCAFDPALGDLIDADAVLGLLADNGGSTFTHALGDRSPAVNAGASQGCPNFDQRGVARSQDGGCDIGAFELQGANLSLVKSATPDPVMAGATLAYRLTVQNAGAESGAKCGHNRHAARRSCLCQRAARFGWRQLDLWPAWRRGHLFG